MFTPSLQDLRRKAARLVSAKCTLAARVDSFHESAEGKVREQEGGVKNSKEMGAGRETRSKVERMN